MIGGGKLSLTNGLKMGLHGATLVRLIEEEDSLMELEAKSLPGSEGIQELEARHRHYSEQLEALIQKPYLSEEEQLEEVRLKKLKLRVKDQMAARRNGQPHSYAV
jgi:hypothetical protein